MFIQNYKWLSLLCTLQITFVLSIPPINPNQYLGEWTEQITEIKQLKNILFYDLRIKVVQLNKLKMEAEYADNRVSMKMYSDFKTIDNEFDAEIDELNQQQDGKLSKEMITDVKSKYYELKKSLRQKVNNCISLKFAKWNKVKAKCDTTEARLFEHVSKAKDALMRMKQLLEMQTSAQIDYEALVETENKIQEAHDHVKEIESDELPSLQDDVKLLKDLRNRIQQCYTRESMDEIPNEIKTLRTKSLNLIIDMKQKLEPQSKVPLL